MGIAPFVVANNIESVKHVKQTITNFNELRDYVDKNSADYASPENLCFVYDVDNTLITQGDSFGGDSWAGWQSSLKDNDKNKVKSWAGASGDNAHAFEGSLRYFMNYRPTENDVAGVVDYIKDTKHHPSIALTARDYEHYNASTDRSLKLNKIDFNTNKIPDPDTGDTKNTLVLTKNKTGEFYKAYNNGIYYSATDNKGVELLAFLNKVRSKNPGMCSSVVFVDNAENNVDDVYNSLKNSDISMTSIHYVTKYDNKPTQKMIDRWKIDGKHSQSKDFYKFLQVVND